MIAALLVLADMTVLLRRDVWIVTRWTRNVPKQELQPATIDAASQVFFDEVVDPAITAPSALA